MEQEAVVVEVGSIGDGVDYHNDDNNNPCHHNVDLSAPHDIRQIWNPGVERMLDLSAEGLVMMVVVGHFWS